MIFRMQMNISGDRAPPETRPAVYRTVYITAVRYPAGTALSVIRVFTALMFSQVFNAFQFTGKHIQ